MRRKARASAARATSSKRGTRSNVSGESLVSRDTEDFGHLDICDIYPSLIDTPGIQHGANYTGRALKPAPPVYAPRRVGAAMVALASRPRRSVTVGSVASLARVGYFVAPRLMRSTMSAVMKAYLAQASRSPITDGNVLQPMAEGRSVEGGWRSPAERSLVVASLAIAAGLAALLVVPRAARGARQ